MDAFFIAIGLFLLVWSADKFVLGASNIARHIKVPLFFIGFLVVGVGTSAPEMIVSAMASLEGNTGLAFGNALGSNVSNIALVLGLTAIVSPIIVDRNIVKVQLPLLFIFSIITFYLLLDFDISIYDGTLISTCMIFSLYLLVKMTPRSVIEENDPEILEREGIEIPDTLSLKMSVFWTFIGMFILFAGSKLLVMGATGFAKAMGMSDLVIGLTIVAVGTSLPELTASIVAAMKKQHDLAFGNIIGSNMFNTLVVIAIPGLIAPGEVPSVAIMRDFIVVLGLTTLLLVYCGRRLNANDRGESGNTSFEAINRVQGATLFIFFIAYMSYVYFDSVG